MIYFIIGKLDVFHDDFITNPGLQHCYPMFCLCNDLVWGAWIIDVAKFKQLSTNKNLKRT